ncbi:rhodanese-like domain-containing protein [Sporosarcina pasteurii]|uniref:Thiosulfate sulfurtransferase glpE n=1 Tax=Sporosarcina pasteurii TaxID=1474 RepID=A0A380CEC9_SPOPA|nr:rhodanese-like domain-containing protein [Sporosarcina pasteurii]MDS9473126.1 rhodanese-like domain-containing protein [Sporosarcina pasteurii]QBQ04225.1 rhodanese-like domain-containing protein [Sporosarcina pasteurii]SUJ17269.1 Thiosulfate sulfurtransferase glpE [Sporosarcina pasteurii]
MDIIQWLIIILLVVFVMRRFLPTKGVTNISVQETKDKLKDKQVQFIDVRTPGEYKANHQPQFKNIPLGDLPRKADQLDKNKEVVVICQSGMRSARAASILKKQGFEKVYNVTGGMGAWR